MLSKIKFSTLTDKRKHKHAANLLVEIFEGKTLFVPIYKEYEGLLDLSPLIFEHKKILERIFFHQEKANIAYPNQYEITKEDSTNSEKKLGLDIYLENLRSMHNIGAIVRSCEAFALGTIYLSKELPSSALKKITKTAMGAETNVDIRVQEDISLLKKPLIAIETDRNAKCCNVFNFPKEGTILFGNEKYGLSDQTLNSCDQIIQIPLYGKKNSLNVTSAFAIIANCIRAS